MVRVGMHEAKTQLSRLVERVEAGEEVIIQRNGKPVARLTTLVAERSSLGTLRGAWRKQMHMSEDFDELPEDIAIALGAE